jgi:Leucine-rich repeat (LRR) protein
MVPEGLWALPNVTVINLEENQLTGGISSNIGNAAMLTILLLARNRFSGAIPSSIGNATNLVSVDLLSNEFFGDIPESIGNLINLVLPPYPESLRFGQDCGVINYEVSFHPCPY